MIHSPGADITHPPPGSKGRPSFTSVVGSVDSNGAKYVSRIAVQTSPRELIEDMEDMCAVRDCAAKLARDQVITQCATACLRAVQGRDGQIPQAHSVLSRLVIQCRLGTGQKLSLPQTASPKVNSRSSSTKNSAAFEVHPAFPELSPLRS